MCVMYSEDKLPVGLRNTLEWFRETFDFDQDMYHRANTDWKLKHPIDVLMSQRGICHDLVSFEAMYLQGMGYEADHLFYFIRNAPDALKLHHSLLYVNCGDLYYIFEPCATYTDNYCYGPFRTLEEYEADLMWRYKKSFASPDYKWFAIFYEHNYSAGMNLEQFIRSWR